MKHILAIMALVVAAPQPQAETRIADGAFVRSMTPPSEFDHPYKGIVILVRTKDQAETRKLCPIPFPQQLALGCARTIPVGCEIIISPNSIIEQAGLTFEFVKRHEEAHCNGWPADHRRAK